jgi:hypothetical protein
MEFFYNSTNGGKRKLPDAEVRAIRDHLVARGLRPDFSKGELHDLLLEYRSLSGSRLMINQLEPVFTYVANTGELWPAEAEAVA